MRTVMTRLAFGGFSVWACSGFAAQAAPPAEVASLNWCTTTTNKDCLEWSPTPNAVTYNAYSGTMATLPNLVTPLDDSCLIGNFAGATTDATVVRVPAPGTFDWYLVRAANADGEGSAGSASTGPRQQTSTGLCQSGLVINEVDYDQPGVDNGEFIEIVNLSGTSEDLTDIAIVLINGADNFEYSRIVLSGTLGPGAYAVVSSPVVVVPFGTRVFPLPVSSNGIQNGSPDGIALFDVANNVLIDALSYEGSITAAQINGAPGTYNLVEGTPTTAADDNLATLRSLIRFPNGVDTNDAASDWIITPAWTPGSANE